jgi:hypothetical protein
MFKAISNVVFGLMLFGVVTLSGCAFVKGALGIPNPLILTEEQQKQESNRQAGEATASLVLAVLGTQTGSRLLGAGLSALLPAGGALGLLRTSATALLGNSQVASIWAPKEPLPPIDPAPKI